MDEIIYRESEIPVSKFLKIVHWCTERAAIKIVPGYEGLEDKFREQYLTKDAHATSEEVNRILKYYGDAPVWNLHVVAEEAYEAETHKRALVLGICANVSYKDIKEGYLREKKDIQAAKRREKTKKKGQNDD